jgi:hypothetical protein
MPQALLILQCMADGWTEAAAEEIPKRD